MKKASNFKKPGACAASWCLSYKEQRSILLILVTVIHGYVVSQFLAFTHCLVSSAKVGVKSCAILCLYQTVQKLSVIVANTDM